MKKIYRIEHKNNNKYFNPFKQNTISTTYEQTEARNDEKGILSEILSHSLRFFFFFLRNSREGNDE